MQLDSATKDKYATEAPELMEAVSEVDVGSIMRRDSDSDYCVKYDNGWCSIHKKYGADFLGDACNFYPRVTRALGAEVVMTATLSCPEVARLALLEDGAHTLVSTESERLPFSLKDYLPEGMDAGKALVAHQAFLDAAGDNDAGPERIMARIISVGQSLDRISKESWPDAAAFYLKQADGRLPVPEFIPTDPYNLLHALSGLVAAAPDTKRPRLEETIELMERGIGGKLDWEKLSIITDESSYPSYLQTLGVWEEYGREMYEPLLRRWIVAQISVALLPFAGFGDTLSQRVIIMGVRFAMVKLAIMCLCADRVVAPGENDVIMVVQSLSRFLDHLADPTMMIQICEETGWIQESRLYGLLRGE